MDGVFFSRPIGFERSPTIEAKAHKPWVKTKRGRMLFRPRHDEPWTINATASSPVCEMWKVLFLDIPWSRLKQRPSVRRPKTLGTADTWTHVSLSRGRRAPTVNAKAHTLHVNTSLDFTQTHTLHHTSCLRRVISFYFYFFVRSQHPREFNALLSCSRQ